MNLLAKELLSIDWDPSTLRLLQVRVKGKHMEVLRAVSVLIPEDVDVRSASSFGEFIRAVLRDQRIRTTQAISAISRDQAVLHTFVLPSLDDADLAGMVRFQVSRELPFPLEEAAIDFAVSRRYGRQESEADRASEENQTQPEPGPRAMDALSGRPKEGTEVLVAAVRQDAVEHTVAIFRHAGLKLLRVGLRPYANLVAVSDAVGLEPHKTLLFVDVGPMMSEINVISEDRLAFSRSAQVSIPLVSPGPVDQADAAAREEAVNDLSVEILRTMQAYRASEQATELDRILVAGGTGVEQKLAERAQQRMGVPAELFLPAEIPVESGQARELRAFAAAFGLALGHVRTGVLHFDFLNPKKPVDREAIKKRQVPVAVATAAMVVLAGFIAAKQVVWAKEKEALLVAEQAGKAKKEADAVEKFIKLVKQVDAWDRESVVWLDVFREFERVFPDRRQAILTGWTATHPKHGARMSLRARADRRDRADEVVERLAKHRMFEPRTGGVKYDPQKREFAKYPWAFSVELRVHPQKPASSKSSSRKVASRKAKRTSSNRAASRPAGRKKVNP